MNTEVNRDINAHGHTIRLNTGALFDPFEPDPTLVTPYVIGYGLSSVYRWAGQVSPRLTVAQHTVMVSHLAEHLAHLWNDVRFQRLMDLAYNPTEEGQGGLLHDVEEGLGFQDLPGPMKAHPLMAGYKSAANKCRDSILIHYGLNPGKSKVVTAADRHIEADEGFILKPSREMHCERFGYLGNVLTPDEALEAWLDRFKALWPGVDVHQPFVKGNRA